LQHRLGVFDPSHTPQRTRGVCDSINTLGLSLIRTQLRRKHLEILQLFHAPQMRFWFVWVFPVLISVRPSAV
jgi:hypothetical protein